MISLNSFNQLQQIYKYVRQQRENQKFYNYLEIAATFSLISLFLFLAIKPTATTISSLLGEIKSKEVLTAQMKTKINSIVQAQNSYSKIQENYDVISSSLPDRPRFYQAATNFSGMAQNSNASLSKIAFDIAPASEPKMSKDITTYSINLTGKNRYTSIVDFIGKILNSRRLIELNSVQLSKTEDKDTLNPDSINVNVKTNLFYLQDSHAKN